ncbi:ER-golgi trafficking TRAPP I complex 85 kDa subunit-domain-containing protein [Pyronema omphalodes]|nr:ER-golgi trafficking TRAPP I complex 85 kDa subunit-domain-containing protein [Pyronema omphalodes]
MTSPASFTDSRPGTPRSRPTYLRSSTIKSSSSSGSLNSLFAAASLRSNPNRTLDDDAKALICRSFVPHIAVHVSADTDELAREKGFANFKEMIRPYGDDLQGRLTIRDSAGISNTYDDFGVRFVGLQEVAMAGEKWETGMTAWANGKEEKETGAWVGGNVDEVEELCELLIERAEGEQIQQVGYLQYLRRLLSALPVSPHETFSHPVACVIAISSRNTNPIESLRNLYQSGNQVQLPGYVSTDYLRYYVLVHDEDRDDIGKSTALFDQMKRHFGLSCHLLRLRSGGKTAITDDDAVVVPTPIWRSASEELSAIAQKDSEESSPLCLPETDASGIAVMVREMTQMSIVPFMERCIATWNDQVASRRRGISGRFLTMSKRYFGGSSNRNSTIAASNYDPVSQSYPPTSPEAQMRKLADFAFMLRDWKLAHSTYDLLKTDFNNDKAWKYHAAAHEMTATSLLLTPTPLSTKARQEIIEPTIDVACYSYISRCAATYSALRCLLISVELLRLRGGGAADDAARWAVRARDTHGLGRTSHALITERVGDCYAQRKGAGNLNIGSRKRKAAMWKILAANEWATAGKPGRARMCLEDALPVYQGTEFGDMEKFIDGLKRTVGMGGEEADEAEELDGGKANRKSLVASMGEGEGVLKEEGGGDFVES